MALLHSSFHKRPSIAACWNQQSKKEPSKKTTKHGPTIDPPVETGRIPSHQGVIKERRGGKALSQKRGIRKWLAVIAH